MKSAYLIGIKGVGMSALAVYLKEASFEVTGSDHKESFVTDKFLKEKGINFFDEFNASNLKNKKPTMVIASAAYGHDNPEIKEAIKRKLNLLYLSC